MVLVFRKIKRLSRFHLAGGDFLYKRIDNSHLFYFSRNVLMPFNQKELLLFLLLISTVILALPPCAGQAISNIVIPLIGFSPG